MSGHTRKAWRGRRGVILAAVLSAAPLSTASLMPLARASSPTYAVDALADRLAAEQRGLDQAANPAYAAKEAPLLAAYAISNGAGILHDPFLAGWSGTIRDVAFPNRYGATLRGHAYVPQLPWHDRVTGAARSRLPGVVFLPGYGGGDESYEGLLEQIADAGYVVLAVDPQGAGRSDVDPKPQRIFCDPHGAWRRPQELGITERGRCAGYDANVDSRSPHERQLDDAVAATPAGATPAAGVADLVGFEADAQQAKSTGNLGPFLDGFATFYDTFRHRFAFAALDTAGWLAAPGNPLRGVIAAGPLGVVGHSAGSDAALVAGNGDPLHRFGAVVAWDDYGRPPPRMHPTVPTMIFQSEQQQDLGPWLPQPSDRLWGAYRIADSFTATGVPHALLALRGSTHQEWSYLPFQGNNPIAPLTNSSRYGGQVSVHETLAWLDRWLKSGQDASAADARLWSRSFDASTDGTSRGQGTFDVVSQGNLPYRIAGRSVTESLSRIFASELYLDGRRCRSWQSGCA